MKQIEVVAAVIICDKKVFCAQRKDGGETAKKWEFPGGKVEEGETRRGALKRELFEELGVTVEVDDFLATVRHQYDSFFLTMVLYTVHITEGQIRLSEHLSSRWLDGENLYSVDWAPADLPVLPKIKNLLS